MRRISTCNVPEDENNLMQTRLSGEFWASDVIMHKAHCEAISLFSFKFLLFGIQFMVKSLKGHSHEDFADFWSELC